MHLLKRASRVWLAAVLGLACGGDGDPGEAPTQSCAIKNSGNVPGSDACTDYVGWPGGVVLQLCSQPGATYSSEACPTSKRIGGCRGSGLAGGHYIRWYYPRADASPSPTAADVMEDCMSIEPKETFVAP
ncbi:MAG TPA: hypothetical protein VGG33_18915 [Polyangia bacterium]